MGWRDWTRKPPQLHVPLAHPSDGWRQGAPDVYTCVAPAGYEKDPAITAAIHEFDPGVIPIWRIQTWLPPRKAQPVLAVHHGIGRFYPYPKQLRRPPRFEMPQQATHPVPNFLDAIFEDQEATHFTGPAGYLPWDWWTYRWCRQQFVYLTTEKYEERLERKRKHLERMRRAYAEENTYNMADFERWALKHLEGVTPRDWREYQELVRTGRQGGRRRAVHSFGPSLPSGRPLGV